MQLSVMLELTKKSYFIALLEYTLYSRDRAKYMYLGAGVN